MKLLTIIALSAITTLAEQPALTLYNQNFAVVREQVALDLTAGENTVAFSGITAHAEPDSVILRDVSRKNALRILEQNYRADPVSQNLLLNHFEGQTIDFLSGTNIIKGKIIRSGYVPHHSAYNRYGAQYRQTQALMSSAQGSGQPIIEVDGKLRFTLPGQPLFPALGNDSVLKPTFNWILESSGAGKTDAELCYVSGGMSWEADYNLVSPENSDDLDLIGWVTMDNQSGRTFENAKIKLMAGDVEKIQQNPMARCKMAARSSMAFDAASAPVVTEKAFDEYHLYELARSTTLRDRETKQVEFLRAQDVDSTTVYVYDGVYVDPNRYRNWRYENIRNNRDYGTVSNPKVWVMREFKNTKENGLGLPLPKGRVRFYRRDSDGQLEFTGENMIDHTPKDETVRIQTGSAFDLVGERKRTNYQIDTSRNWLDESFEIKLRNRKENQPVEIRVVEHLYRSATWEISESSHMHLKTAANTLEFRIKVNPGEEKILTYKAHYTW